MLQGGEGRGLRGCGTCLPSHCCSLQGSAWTSPTCLCQSNTLCSFSRLSSLWIPALLTSDLGTPPRARRCCLCLCKDSLLPREVLVAAGRFLQSDRNLACSCCALSGWCFVLNICRIFLFIFPLALSSFQMHCSLLVVALCCNYLCSDVSDKGAALWCRVSFLISLPTCPACPLRLTCHGFRSPTVEQTYPGWIWCVFLVPFFPKQALLGWFSSISLLYFNWAPKFLGDIWKNHLWCLGCRQMRAWNSCGQSPNPVPISPRLLELSVRTAEPADLRWCLLGAQLRNLQLWRG